ncbi:MAG: HNH endonuclease [Microcystaceae cyanobacterium]
MESIEIQVTGGITLVDEQDADYTNQWKWRFDKGRYIVRGERRAGKYSLIRLHRAIIIRSGYDLERSEIIDHVNHVRHDNRRSNLRICSTSENMTNKVWSDDVGLSFDKRTGWWRVRVQKDGHSVYVGTFPTKEIAMHYRNECAKQLHGNFVNLGETNV